MDWDLGDGQKVRCFGPGTIYNPSLPLSTQTPDCTHTYRQPRDQATIKAAITYGTVAVVEAPNLPAREDVLQAQVARDELKVKVNELQALDPGRPLSALFPPGAEGGAPPSSAQVEIPPDNPGVARDGEYFPQPKSGWDRFTGFVKDVGPTILKTAAVIGTALAVSALVGLVCATGVGCVLLAGALAGMAAGALAGGLFCGATAECIGKGALAGAVVGLAFAGAPLLLPLLPGVTATTFGAVGTAAVSGALAGFAGSLTDGLLNGNTNPKTILASTVIGALTAGLLAKAAPGLMSRLKLGRSAAPAAERALPAELEKAMSGAPKGTPGTPVEAGESVRYKEGTGSGRGVVGDKLTPDHIPSRAALVEAEQSSRWADEAARLGRPFRPAEQEALRLTKAEKDLIRDEGQALVKDEDFHKDYSRIYGKENTPAQIAEDAANLARAVQSDFVKDLSTLEKMGQLTQSKVAEYIQHYQQVVDNGVISYSNDVERSLLDYLSRAI